MVEECELRKHYIQEFHIPILRHTSNGNSHKEPMNGGMSCPSLQVITRS